MTRGIVAALASLALAAGAARAETLGELLNARGLTPPAGSVPGLDQAVQGSQVLDDPRGVFAVHQVGGRESARLQATRWERASRTWTSVPLEWSAGALGVDLCRGGLAIEPFAGGFLVTAHINPSAECTLVLGPDLSVRAVLAGWPVAKLADGRIVYRRNQIHFASFHPVGIALFDPRGPAEVTLYPREPYQAARAAHVARMRAVYTQSWCAAHNHPCDPEIFDEHVAGEIVTDARGDALAFVMAWDNTTGWSDAERWGRLEAFRETRAALARWDGRGDPPADLHRGLAAGLARIRNMKGERHVTAALEGEPALRDLVGSALGAAPAVGRAPQAWLVALDARWAEAATWQRLARAVAVADEFTEVVYVYANLRRPARIRYRELLRNDFAARFGAIPLRRALEPDLLRQILGAD